MGDPSPPGSARGAGGRVAAEVSVDVAARLATDLPELTGRERHGNRTWYLAGKGLAWGRPTLTRWC